MAIHVQSGSVASLGALADITIADVGHLSRAFVVVQRAYWGANTEATADDWAIEGRLLNTTTLRLQKLSAVDGAAQWWVVWCDREEFRVQHVEHLIAVNEASRTVILPEEVDPARTLVFGSGRTNVPLTATQSSNAFVTYHLTGSTEVVVQRGGSPNARWFFFLEVVEWAAELGVVVTRGLAALSGDLATVGADVAHGQVIAPERTLLVASYRHSTANLEACNLSLAVQGTEHLRFARHTATTSWNSWAAWQVALFPAGSGLAVEHVVREAASGETAVIDAIGEVVLGHSVILRTGQASAGSFAEFPRALWVAAFPSASLIGHFRHLAGAAGRVTSLVADFAAFHVLVAGEPAWAEAVAAGVDLAVAAPLGEASGQGEAGSLELDFQVPLEASTASAAAQALVAEIGAQLAAAAAEGISEPLSLELLAGLAAASAEASAVGLGAALGANLAGSEAQASAQAVALALEFELGQAHAEGAAIAGELVDAETYDLGTAWGEAVPVEGELTLELELEPAYAQSAAVAGELVDAETHDLAAAWAEATPVAIEVTLELVGQLAWAAAVAIPGSWLGLSTVTAGSRGRVTIARGLRAQVDVGAKRTTRATLASKSFGAVEIA